MFIAHETPYVNIIESANLVIVDEHNKRICNKDMFDSRNMFEVDGFVVYYRCPCGDDVIMQRTMGARSNKFEVEIMCPHCKDFWTLNHKTRGKWYLFSEIPVKYSVDELAYPGVFG